MTAEAPRCAVSQPCATVVGRLWFAWLAAFGAWLILGGVAAAHTRSISYSLWDIDDGGAAVRLRVSRLELTRLALDPLASADDEQTVIAMLPAAVRMAAGGEWCRPVEPPRRMTASEGNLVYGWRVECAAADERVIESRFLLDVAPSHLHFARVERAGQPPVERVLTEAEPSWELGSAAGAAAAPAGGTSLLGYVELGVEHILTGWDHLAFVLGLLLLAYTLRDIAMLVTSFTIAHSITLALAVSGVVEPRVQVVEALIGFSIALVGIENAWLLAGRGIALPLLVIGGLGAIALAGASLPLAGILGLALFTACHFALLRRAARPERLRAAVAFAFGLIHGFGFAGILMELDLERIRLAPALFGFNAGVELGQLAVVAVVWPLLLAARRTPRAAAWVADLGSAAVAGLGLYWFVVRSF